MYKKQHSIKHNIAHIYSHRNLHLVWTTGSNNPQCWQLQTHKNTYTCNQTQTCTDRQVCPVRRLMMQPLAATSVVAPSCNSVWRMWWYYLNYTGHSVYHACWLLFSTSSVVSCSSSYLNNVVVCVQQTFAQQHSIDIKITLKLCLDWQPWKYSRGI